MALQTRAPSAALVFLVIVQSAFAQLPDHLQCFKIKDPQAKVSYTADLGALVAEPGCTIKVPATVACVPATKTNVTPTPPGGGGTGTPNSFFCYKIKCPRTALPTLSGADQFGSRTVRPTGAKLICSPLAGPSTTTTTASTSTTTTTGPCTGTTGHPNCGCNSNCFCWADVSGTGPVCIDVYDPPNCVNTNCSADSDCGPFQKCIVQTTTNSCCPICPSVCP